VSAQRAAPPEQHVWTHLSISSACAAPPADPAVNLVPPRSLTGANQEVNPRLRAICGLASLAGAAPTFLCPAGSRASALVPARLLNRRIQTESCLPAEQGSDSGAEPCEQNGGSLSPVAGVRPARSPEEPFLQTSTKTEHARRCGAASPAVVAAISSHFGTCVEHHSR
jgi:hypothetical protein